MTSTTSHAHTHGRWHRNRLLAAACLLVWLGAPAVVRAQETTLKDTPRTAPKSVAKPASPKPWAIGVSDAQRAAALQEFRRGNGFFEQRQFASALARYRVAVKSWSHPAIHFNMAVCLVHLDRPVEAFKNATAALKFGKAPLGKRVYKQALTLRKLLRERLAVVRVVCKEPGARVSLDGKYLFTAPGQHEQVILPGKHAVVASKKGFLTESRAPFLIPNKVTVVRVWLLPMSAAIKMRRRWKRWIPWTVLAAGAALAASGIPLLLKAKADAEDYDAQVREICPAGCPQNELPKAVADIKNSGRQANVAGLTLLGIGGAVIGAGIVLVILNQPRAVRVSPKDVKPRTRPGAGVSIEPTVGPRGAGFSATIRF